LRQADRHVADLAVIDQAIADTVERIRRTNEEMDCDLARLRTQIEALTMARQRTAERAGEPRQDISLDQLKQTLAGDGTPPSHIRFDREGGFSDN
jgi:hypothetical protein